MRPGLLQAKQHLVTYRTAQEEQLFHAGGKLTILGLFIGLAEVQAYLSIKAEPLESGHNIYCNVC